MKRNVTTLIMISLVMFLLVGCGNSKGPDLLLNDYIKDIKELNIEGLDKKEYSQNEKESSEEILEDELINKLIEILKPYASKTKHKVKSIDEYEDNKAMAVVEFEYIDLSLATENAMRNYMQEIMDIALSEENSDMSDEELELLLVDSLKSNIEATTSAYGEQYTDTELIIEMIKVDDDWYIDDPNEALLNVVTLNVLATMDDDNIFDFDDELSSSNDVVEIEVKLGESFKLGRNEITINSVEKDHESSQNLIIIDLTWTNKSNETRSWSGSTNSESMNTQAFQDGIELQGFQAGGNSNKEIRPDITLENVEEVFEISNNNDIEFEISYENYENGSIYYEKAIIKLEIEQ